MAQQVKRAFKYRFFPTDEQAAELSRTFGCVRLVYNKALEERTRARYGEQRRVSCVQSSAPLTTFGNLSAFTWREGQLTLAKTSEPSDIRWSRPLPRGTQPTKLPLSVREWTCDCGAVHDRDVNAARNIPAAGLTAAACGDGVRPQQESSRTGRSSVKQEPSGRPLDSPALRRGRKSMRASSLRAPDTP